MIYTIVTMTIRIKIITTTIHNTIITFHVITNISFHTTAIIMLIFIFKINEKWIEKKEIEKQKQNIEKRKLKL